MFDKQIIFISCCIQLIVTFTMHEIAMDRTVKLFTEKIYPGTEFNLREIVKNRGSYLRKGSYLHLTLKIDLKVKINGTVKFPPRSWSTFVRTIFRR